MKIMRCITILLCALLVACAPVVTPTLPPPTLLPSTQTPTMTAAPVSDAAFLPNPRLTPGALNPAVSQQTIQTTICVSGYSSSIRPPVSYTDQLKTVQIGQYGYADVNPSDYEEDHLISLSAGGNPTDPHNLWPQPRYTTPYSATQKDALEYRLYRMICAGQVLLADAQRMLAGDWVAAYRSLFGAPVLSFPTPFPTEP